MNNHRNWALFGFLILSTLLTHRAAAQAGVRWEWHVSGLSETFATKGAAHTALLNRGGEYAYLDHEEGLSDLGSQWEYYKYSATPRDTVTGAWTYWDGSYSFPTEPEAYSFALQSLAEYSSPQCTARLEPRTDWSSTNNFWGISTAGNKEFDDIRSFWSENPPPPHCNEQGPLTWVMSRNRTVGCEYPFQPNHSIQKCVLYTYGYIYKAPLVAGMCVDFPCFPGHRPKLSS